MEEEKVETLWKSLVKIYKVPPKLVFSIIGDSETFVPKVWPRPIFQTALMEAAKQSDGDTWVLFQGQGNGISSLIWEAFDNYTYLEKQNLSVNEEIKIECFPVKAITLKFGTSAKKVMKLEDHIACTISETKDHFRDARLKFECFIKKQTVSFMKEKVPPKRKTDLELELPVPVVRVLVEGDLNSIVEIVESVKQNIPVVIVKGSGKAANLILNYIEKQQSLKSDAALLFGIRFQSKTFEKLKEGLDELRTFEHLINVFDVEKNNAIYFLQVTGEAIVRAWAYAYFKNKEKSDSEGTDKPVAFFSQHVKKKQYQRTLVRDEKDMQFDVMPASLPLFFYFGYQVLQEKGKLIDCGYVNILKTVQCYNIKKIISRTSTSLSFTNRDRKDLYPLLIKKKHNWSSRPPFIDMLQSIKLNEVFHH
ncbi:transient receptor potential cation channel subfamily M member-like 2 [Saccostrea cucullata]|uniref:transient receptor potential cation channel subfamily M member-like 2 n=1 Tax=Saccostrea cuccullata TaxID=36930 RepID=UPI002ED0ED87